MSPTHQYGDSGTHDVTLTVTDNEANTAQLTRKVTSTDTGLVARFRTKKDDTNNLKIWFNGEYSHDAAGADVASLHWSFGDGSYDSEGNPPSGDYDWLLVDNASRLIDWSKAGVYDARDNSKGIPVYPVGINLTGLTSYGGYTLDNTGVADSRNAINAALTACPNYNAVLLGPGSYLISSGGISIPSYKVLRGTEPFTTHPLTTIIHSHLLTTNLFSIGTSGKGENPSSSDLANITSVSKGSDTITVDSVSNFSVGDEVFIDELNDQDFVSIGGTENTCTWCSRSSGARSLDEVKIIKAINGLDIQFTRPAYRTYWNSPQLVKDVASGSRVINAGIESLRIMTDGTPPSVDYSNAIYIFHASYSWVKRVEVSNEYYKAIVMQYYNIGMEVRECYIHDVPAPAYMVSGNYSILLANHNTDCLVENNICYHVHSSQTLGSGGSTGNVIGYNFFYNGYHYSSPTWFLGGTGHHGAHPYMNLWEGNYIRKIFHDVIQGGSSHSIWFRTRVTGMPINSSEVGSDPTWPTINQEMSVCNMPTFSYYCSVIGSVLGTAGYDTVYETYPIASSTKQIWKLGFSNQNATGSPTDPKTAATLLRHGNYDTVTASTKWDAGISGRSIPYSLYLSSKPSFFGSLPWPPFGTDLTPMVGDIPAKVRFDAGTYFA